MKYILLIVVSVTSVQCQRSRFPQPSAVRSRPTTKPNIIFGGFGPIVNPEEGRRPLRFRSEEDLRHENFIQGTNRVLRTTTQTPRFNTRTTEQPFQSNQRLPFDYDDYEEDPLPSGPTREPPLPSGPTRRPGQPLRQPAGPVAGVDRDVFSSLPLLTTRVPETVTPRPNVNFLLSLPDNIGPEPKFQLPPRQGPHGGVLVTSNLDVLDQTKLFTDMDPNQEQFIKVPRLNAGALPLAFESSIPLGRFPPFILP